MFQIVLFYKLHMFLHLIHIIFRSFWSFSPANFQLIFLTVVILFIYSLIRTQKFDLIRSLRIKISKLTQNKFLLTAKFIHLNSQNWRNANVTKTWNGISLYYFSFLMFIRCSIWLPFSSQKQTITNLEELRNRFKLKILKYIEILREKTILNLLFLPAEHWHENMILWQLTIYSMSRDKMEQTKTIKKYLQKFLAVWRIKHR